MVLHPTSRWFAFLVLLLGAGPLLAADYSGLAVGDGVGAGDTRHCGYRADCVVRPPQTPPRDDALARRLTFGSASTGGRDGHPTRFVPGPAHALGVAFQTLTEPFTAQQAIERRVGDLVADDPTFAQQAFLLEPEAL